MFLLQQNISTDGFLSVVVFEFGNTQIVAMLLFWSFLQIQKPFYPWYFSYFIINCYLYTLKVICSTLLVESDTILRLE